ncbi:S1 family peptidase [Streptomyces sp. MMG1121]|uniref:S1 family peptidase n=1 Tax=Streptomyces sp. MMG1121 TaxID=1415544 RepID=UPI000D14BCBD|nr:S1 family peptidase [Streptomyces sp. MMG1121]
MGGGLRLESQWVLTAASCFADSSDPGAAIAAGKPKLATTATIGRLDSTTTAGQVRDVIELRPRADRDLVLAKLSTPVTGITPVAIATAKPSVNDALEIAGYGRTASQWVPAKLHTGILKVSAVNDTTLGLEGDNPATGSICMGDAGGPALRKNDGRLELVGVHSATNEAGCVGSDSAQSKASETRLDDVRDWVQATVARWSLKASANGKYVAAEFSDTGNQRGKLRARSDNPAGSWEQFTLHTSPKGGVSLRTVYENLYVSVEIDDSGSHEGMLRARSSSAGAWERLQLVGQSGGTYGINALQNGRSVAVEIKDSGPDYGLLRARADSIGGWERFSFQRADNFPTLASSDNKPVPVPAA